LCRKTTFKAKSIDSNKNPTGGSYAINSKAIKKELKPHVMGYTLKLRLIHWLFTFSDTLLLTEVHDNWSYATWHLIESRRTRPSKNPKMNFCESLENAVKVTLSFALHFLISKSIFGYMTPPPNSHVPEPDPSVKVSKMS